MGNLWHTLGHMNPRLLTFIKRHSSHRLRFWLRQHLGADYRSIPEGIASVQDGRRFHIGPDPVYWPIYHGLDYEPEPTSILRQIIRPGDSVIDVGANIGWYTTLCALLTGKNGSVTAFEPVPTNLNRLKANLELNGMDVTVVSCAVSDTEGITRMYIPKANRGAWASLSPVEEDCDEMEVRTIRLDSYLEANGKTPIHFMKCDAEGAELSILRGAEHLLASPEAPILMLELNEDTISCAGYRKRDLRNFLQEKGYDGFYQILYQDQLTPLGDEDSFCRQDLVLCDKGGMISQRLSGSAITIR